MVGRDSRKFTVTFEFDVERVVIKSVMASVVARSYKVQEMWQVF